MAVNNGSNTGKFIPVQEEDLQELEELLKSLRARVDQYHGDGRIFMMAQYTRLIALVSAEVNRIQRRFNRESLAAMRAEYKALKLEQKAAAGQENGE